MPNLTFVQTADGSKTIFNAGVGEHYHSLHGAVQESKHVFVESGLKYFLAKSDTAELSILEVGFGTGLNFLLSADFCAESEVQLYYSGIEAFPLPADMIAETGYQDHVSPEIWAAFLQNYSAAFDGPAQLDSFGILQLFEKKLMDFSSAKRYDVLYFDAFAAVHQPEMWAHQTLAHVCSFIRPGGVFVTYAITGNLKRSMRALGFSVEKAPGAPGKREMLRAVKL